MVTDVVMHVSLAGSHMQANQIDITDYRCCMASARPVHGPTHMDALHRRTASCGCWQDTCRQQ
jgi:hypothetical protein